MDDWSELDAPVDLVRTLDWLLGAGFEVVRYVTRDQPHGNRVVGLRRGDEDVFVVRDRGQWEFSLRAEGWAAGLDALHEAATGEVHVDRPGQPLPLQYPSDELVWAEAVPGFFAWRDANPAWRERVEEAFAARATRIHRRRPR